MATSTLGLTLPTVGGSKNTWGTLLNADLALINLLGGIPTTNVNAAFAVVPSLFPIQVLRVTTAGLNIPCTLPDPSLVAGKVFVFFKVDAGTGVVQILATAINNQAEWDLTNQYNYVWIYSNGSSYDVLGSS